MKINNINHINALAQETIRNLPLKNLLSHGQTSGLATPSAPASPQTSQLSQLLALLNLFPLLKTGGQSATSPPPVLAPLIDKLLDKLLMPQNPQQAAKWLAEHQPEKALLEALRLLSTPPLDTESNGKFKSLLMLMAEQRINEQSKPGDFHWLFPFRDNELSPVHVNVEKKTGKQRKKVRWCITLNLTLSKHRQLTATAELEGNALSLSFATDAEGLKAQLENALLLLEKKLSQHHLTLTQCEVVTLAEAPAETVTSGVDIQV